MFPDCVIGSRGRLAQLLFRLAVALVVVAGQAPGRIAAQSVEPEWVAISQPETGNVESEKATSQATPLVEKSAPPIEQLLDQPIPYLPAPKNGRIQLEASWENGLWFGSDDNQFHLHVGGSAQVDSTWLIGPNGVFAIPGGAQNGIDNAAATFLRRARFRFEGDIFEQFDYIVEYDLAHAANDGGSAPQSFGDITGSPAPINIWMQIREVPRVGNVRVGFQTKPIGMTNNTFQGNLPFLERADNHDAFYAPFDGGSALGISAQNWTESERVAWRYGIYRPSTNLYGVALNKFIWGARVTGLPLYENDGTRLIHVGLGTWNGEVVQDQLRVRARPVLRNGPGYAVPVLVDTGQVPGSRQFMIAPEFAMVLGSWTFQAEWAGQFLTDAFAPNGQAQGTVFYHGGYAEALYFLTGEHQPYLKRDGAFGRVIPNNDYHVRKNDPYCALGAWQVGARVSYLNLNDKGIQGGQIFDFTVGLNWYLNANMKFQFNYILEHRDAPQGVVVGWINGLGVRAAYNF